MLFNVVDTFSTLNSIFILKKFCINMPTACETQFINTPHDIYFRLYR